MPGSRSNPYGYTKLVVGRMLRDAQIADGIRHVALRYFNAAGADPEGELGELHEPETHLIPLVLFTAMGRRPSIQVFGRLMLRQTAAVSVTTSTSAT
jgi:UDP-arabinose 4-epimerase